MSYLKTYRVAVLQPDDAGGLTAVHAFTLPAAQVKERMGPDDRDLVTAAGLAWELATTDPDLLPYPFKQMAWGCQTHAGRTFAHGDVMAVTGPAGAGLALRWADQGWEQLQTWPPAALPGFDAPSASAGQQSGTSAPALTGLGPPELW